MENFRNSTLYALLLPTSPHTSERGLTRFEDFAAVGKNPDVLEENDFCGTKLTGNLMWSNTLSSERIGFGYAALNRNLLTLWKFTLSASFIYLVNV